MRVLSKKQQWENLLDVPLLKFLVFSEEIGSSPLYI